MCDVTALLTPLLGSGAASVVAPLAMGALASSAMPDVSTPNMQRDPDPNAGPAPSATAAPSDVSVQNAQQEERRKQLMQQGLRKTLVSGSRGDTSAAPVQRKSLLGDSIKL